MPLIAGGILLFAIVIAVAARPKEENPTTGTSVTAPVAEQAAPTTIPAPVPSPTPAAKPATKPTTKPTAKPAPAPIQTATNPAAIGRAPTIVSDQLQIMATVSQYGADLTWTKSYNKTIKGYVIVKSVSDTNPYYPKQYWSMFRNPDTGNFTWQDRNIEKGKKTYYRACALLTDESVLCGNVISALKP